MMSLAPFFQIGQASGDSWTQILVWIIILAVVWIILRFIARMAARVFTIGCVVIILLGLALLIRSYLP